MEYARLPIGSDAWTCAGEYEDEYKARVAYVVKTLDRPALRSYLSGLRGGLACALSDNFSVGSFNFVIRATFKDGIDWIVRLRMPPVEIFKLNADGTSKSHTVTDRVRRRYEMQSELDTMEFLRLNTNIVIPQVHGYDLDENNAVGFPFVIMDYIHGTTAEELSRSFPGNHEGIPPQYQEKFWRQIATVMVTLANIRFPQSGSIIRSNAGSFHVDRFVDTGTGPYNNVKDFLQDYPRALKEATYTTIDGDRGQGALLEELNAAASTSSAALNSSEETFGLANYDLGPNNVIVDHEFNILSIIDWDSVVAVPDPALYRLPFLMGVAAPRPGISETHPRVLAREELGKAFARVVEQVSQELKSEKDIEEQQRFFSFTQDGFCNKEANLYRALIFLRFKQSFVNREWTEVLGSLRKNE